MGKIGEHGEVELHEGVVACCSFTFCSYHFLSSTLISMSLHLPVTVVIASLILKQNKLTLILYTVHISNNLTNILNLLLLIILIFNGPDGTIYYTKITKI